MAVLRWGRCVYSELFRDDPVRSSLTKLAESGPARLRLRICSNDPWILSWPWEAVHDPDGDASVCDTLIERQVGAAFHPPRSHELPTDRFNILAVSLGSDASAPAAAADSHLLTALLRDESLPTDVTFLRAATDQELAEQLAGLTGDAHVLHLELVKEQTASRLVDVLGRHRFPLVILHARSQPRESFTAMAMALLKAGIGCVVTFEYALPARVSHIFLQQFHRQLLQGTDIAAAVRAGRQELDWFVSRQQDKQTRDWSPWAWLSPMVFLSSAANRSELRSFEPAESVAETPPAGDSDRRVETQKRDQPEPKSSDDGREQQVPPAWREELSQLIAVAEHFCDRFREYLTPDDEQRLRSLIDEANEAVKADRSGDCAAIKNKLTSAIFGSGTASILFLAERAQDMADSKTAREISRIRMEVMKAHRDNDAARLQLHCDKLKVATHAVLIAAVGLGTKCGV